MRRAFSWAKPAIGRYPVRSADQRRCGVGSRGDRRIRASGRSDNWDAAKISQVGEPNTGLSRTGSQRSSNQPARSKLCEGPTTSFVQLGAKTYDQLLHTHCWRRGSHRDVGSHGCRTLALVGRPRASRRCYGFAVPSHGSPRRVLPDRDRGGGAGRIGCSSLRLVPVVKSDHPAVNIAQSPALAQGILTNAGVNAEAHRLGSNTPLVVSFSQHRSRLKG